MGRGEDLRGAFRALRALGLDVAIRDIYAWDPPDPGLARELGEFVGPSLSSHTNVFYVNGDEVEPVIDRLGGRAVGARHIICPQWELGTYPRTWAAQLDRFDEIWAPSRFVLSALRGTVSRPVRRVPLAVQPRMTSFLPRRHFGLPESSYLFLFLFDFRSYVDRKNPFGVIDAFGRVCMLRPRADTFLVIKLNGVDATERIARAYQRFLDAVARSESRDRIIVLDRVLSDNESKNLIRECDCFVSLHRSEGFGRGMAEAMLFGKPVVATGYSGNLEFMNERNSCLVRYRLVDVREGQYPYSEGQVWADPEVDHAVDYMVGLLDDRDRGRELGREAACDMATYFSARAVGLAMAAQLAGGLGRGSEIRTLGPWEDGACRGPAGPREAGPVACRERAR
jgi:glycosyltransferase involved in cell wall biosynthesis